MEKYFVIVFEGKKYKVKIDQQLSALLSQLSYNEEGILIRNNEDLAKTYEINRVLGCALTNYINQYTEHPVNFPFKEKKDNVSQSDVYFINRQVDELAITYNNLRVKTRENKKEETVSVLQSKESTVDLLDADNNLSKMIFLSQNMSIHEKITLAKKVFERTLKDKLLSKYLDLETINKVFDKIIIVENSEELVREHLKRSGIENPSEEYIRSLNVVSAFHDRATGETIIKRDASLVDIIHELIHACSFDKGYGIIKTLFEEKKVNKDWQNLKLSDINSLNEAITEAIASMMLYELPLDKVCAYEYGAKFMKRCMELQYEYQPNQSNILDGYFKGDISGIRSLAILINMANKDLDLNTWILLLRTFSIVENINANHNFNGILGALPKEKMQEILNNLEKEMQNRSKSKYGLEEYHKMREAYAEYESEKIANIRQAKMSIVNDSFNEEMSYSSGVPNRT